MEDNIHGSSTIVNASLRSNDLRIAMVGDSGFMLFRGGGLVCRSEEMQHSFNYPFQIGSMPSATPDTVMSIIVKVMPGDLLIIATDGLFDNMFDDEITEMVSDMIKRESRTVPKEVIQTTLCQRLATDLASRALEVSMDRQADTPFSTRAIEEGLYFNGGKKDDITVLVGCVVENEDSPDRR